MEWKGILVIPGWTENPTGAKIRQVTRAVGRKTFWRKKLASSRVGCASLFVASLSVAFWHSNHKGRPAKRQTSAFFNQSIMYFSWTGYIYICFNIIAINYFCPTGATYSQKMWYSARAIFIFTFSYISWLSIHLLSVTSNYPPNPQITWMWDIWNQIWCEICLTVWHQGNILPKSTLAPNCESYHLSAPKKGSGKPRWWRNI